MLINPERNVFPAAPTRRYGGRGIYRLESCVCVYFCDRPVLFWEVLTMFLSFFRKKVEKAAEAIEETPAEIAKDAMEVRDTIYGRFYDFNGSVIM